MVAHVAPHPINFDPIVPVLGRILMEVDVSRSLKTGIDCLDSTALLNVSVASLKSVPYVFHSDKGFVQEFENGMSCRLRYLESAVLATASLVYNVVLGVFFSLASLVTFGMVKMLTHQMQKHWTHTALAAGSLGVATIGTVSPEWGLKANAMGLLAVGACLSQWIQGDVIGKIGDAYQRHRQELKDATLIAVNNDMHFFNRDCAPLFHYLDANLTNQVQTFGKFMEVMQGAREFVPDVQPTVSPELVMEHVNRVVNQWNRTSGHSTAVTV